MAGYYDRDRNQRDLADGSIYTAPTAAGTMNHSFSHHSNSNEYISSGMPFVFTQATEQSSSDQLVTIEFPYVTRWLMVNVYDGTHEDGDPLPGTLENKVRVGFGNKDADEGVIGPENIERLCKVRRSPEGEPRGAAAERTPSRVRRWSWR